MGKAKPSHVTSCSGELARLERPPNLHYGLRRGNSPVNCCSYNTIARQIIGVQMQAIILYLGCAIKGPTVLLQLLRRRGSKDRILLELPLLPLQFSRGGEVLSI